jgi:hypothetical protein
VGDSQPRDPSAVSKPPGDGLRIAGRVVAALILPAVVWAAILFIFPATPPEPASSSEQNAQVTGVRTRSRTLALTLTSNSLDIRAEAEYERDDPRGIAVMHARVSTQSWFRGTFGTVSVNMSPVEYSIADADLHWTVTADSVWVRSSKSLTQSLVSSVDVNLNKDFPSFYADLVTLRISEYTLRSMDPEPLTYANGLASWRGSGQASPQIRVGLDYTGPGKIVDFLRRQPQLGLVWDNVLFLPGALSAIVPIVVALWLAVRLRAAGPETDDSPTRGTRLLALWLGASIAFYILLASENLAPSQIDPARPVMQQFEAMFWRRMAVASAIGLGGAALAFAIHRTTRVPRVPRDVSLFVGRGLLIGGLIVALFEAALWYLPQRVPNDRWQLLTFAMGFALQGTLGGYTAHELNRMAKLNHPVWKRTLFLIALTGIVLLTPWETRLFGDRTYPTWILVEGTLPTTLSSLLTIGRIATLLVLIYLLRRDFPQSALGEKWVIVFVFAAFAVGMYPLVIWGVFPLSFLLAVLFARLLLLQPYERMKTMAAVRDEIVKNRDEWLKAALNALQAEDLLVATRNALQKKAKSGDITVAEYQSRLDELEDYVETQKLKESVGGLPAHEVVLVFGPRDTSFDNGILGLLLAGAFAVPFVAVQFALLGFPYAGQVQYPILYVVTAIAASAIGWPAAGFFFGYFLQNLKFGSGLSKGLLIGSVVALMRLPEFLTGIQSVAEVTVTVLGAVWTIVFFAVLGLVFDYLTWRRAYGRRDALRSMSNVAGLQPTVAALSLALPSIGVALLTALTGQFGQVVSLLLKLVPPPANAGPPG